MSPIGIHIVGIISLKSSVYFILTAHIGWTTYQVLSSHMWSVVNILDRAALHHGFWMRILEVSEFLHLRLCLEGLQGYLVKPLIQKEMTFLKVTRCSQQSWSPHPRVWVPVSDNSPTPAAPCRWRWDADELHKGVKSEQEVKLEDPGGR